MELQFTVPDIHGLIANMFQVAIFLRFIGAQMQPNNGNEIFKGHLPKNWSLVAEGYEPENGFI